MPEAKPMPITDYINTMNRLYGNSGGAVKKAEAPHGTEPDYYEPREMEDIKKTLPVSEMVKQPKKKIIKKTLIVEKPKPTYLNGNVIDITPLIDDEWWNIIGCREGTTALCVSPSHACVHTCHRANDYTQAIHRPLMATGGRRMDIRDRLS